MTVPNRAIESLLNCKSLYLELADQEIATGGKYAFDYLNLSALSIATASKCYISMKDLNEAQSAIENGYKMIEPLYRKYVDTQLTERPGVYLHRNMTGKMRLSRFAKVVGWSQNRQVSESDAFDQYRRDLSDKEMEDSLRKLSPAVLGPALQKPRKVVIRRPVPDDLFEHLEHAVDRIESSIETCDRLKSHSDMLRLVLNKAAISEEIICEYPVPGIEPGLEYVSDAALSS